MEVALPGTEHAEPRPGWSFLRGGVFKGAEGVGSFRRFPNPPTWAEFAVAAGLWAGFPRLLPVGEPSYWLLRSYLLRSYPPAAARPAPSGVGHSVIGRYGT